MIGQFKYFGRRTSNADWSIQKIAWWSLNIQIHNTVTNCKILFQGRREYHFFLSTMKNVFDENSEQEPASPTKQFHVSYGTNANNCLRVVRFSPFCLSAHNTRLQGYVQINVDPCLYWMKLDPSPKKKGTGVYQRRHSPKQQLLQQIKRQPSCMLPYRMGKYTSLGRWWWKTGKT